MSFSVGPVDLWAGSERACVSVGVIKSSHPISLCFAANSMTVEVGSEQSICGLVCVEAVWVNFFKFLFLFSAACHSKPTLPALNLE